MTYKKFFETYGVIIFTFVLIAQLLPQFFIYFSDIALILGTLLYSKYSKKLLIFFLPFFIFSIFLLLFKDFSQVKQIIPNVRIFLALNMVLWIKNFSIYQSKTILKIIFSITVVLIIGINIIGSLDVEQYKEIVSFWNGEYRKLGIQKITVSEMVAYERLSSFFPQPASSGLFHSVLLIFIIMMYLNYKKFYLLLLMGIIYWSGYISLSSILQYFHILLIVTFVFSKILNHYKLEIILISLIPFLITSIIFLFFADENSYVYKITNAITGNRHLIDGNHYEPFIQMGFKEYLIGYSFSDITENFHRALGDSSFLTKLFLGGIFYYLAFIIFVILSYTYLFKLFCNDRKDKILFIMYFSLVTFVEIGLTGYSQPQITVLSLSFFCLFFHINQKKVNR